METCSCCHNCVKHCNCHYGCLDWNGSAPRQENDGTGGKCPECKVEGDKS